MADLPTPAAGAQVALPADDALGDDDATSLARRLARREVSPAELLRAATARAHAADEALNAVTSWVGRPPAHHDPDAPFAGVPTVVKDNEDLLGVPTSEGSWAVPDRPAPRSSPITDQLLGVGLVPVAKTTLSEFGLTATTETARYGVTRNPWDTGRSPGGSSGGSAALVAAGVVPLAHGNDGGGSIRIPAACCGLVGLKPTRGRLPDLPALERLPVPITVQGVLTRTVRDTAGYLAAAERLFRDPRLPAVGHVQQPDPRRLRIGLVTGAIRGLPVAAEVVAAVESAGGLCEQLGHRVETVELPVDEQFGLDFLRYWAFLALIVTAGGRMLYGPGFDRRRVEPLTAELARLARARAATLPGTVRRLRRLAREHEQTFRTFDVVLSPVLAHEPPPLGHLGPDVPPRTHLVRLLRYTTFTPLQNVSGSPAVSLPLARTRDGLPLGIQLAGPFGEERRLLSLALELEAARPWPLRPTPPPPGGGSGGVG